jgi:hypothetical protein
VPRPAPLLPPPYDPALVSLAQGGFGEVYRTVDRRRSETVALQTLGTGEPVALCATGS